MTSCSGGGRTDADAAGRRECVGHLAVINHLHGHVAHGQHSGQLSGVRSARAPQSHAPQSRQSSETEGEARETAADEPPTPAEGTAVLCASQSSSPASTEAVQRARLAPLRLSAQERALLAVLEGCLQVMLLLMRWLA